MPRGIHITKRVVLASAEPEAPSLQKTHTVRQILKKNFI
jgi:hypothetical protein